MINIRPGGHGTSADIALVAAELAKFPAAELAMLEAAAIGVIACWDSVVDHRPDLKDEHPRHWAKGTNWTVVPGCYAPDERNVIIATVPDPGGGRRIPPYGVKHGSFNLVLHETMHADDYAADRRRCRNPGFVAARNIELARVPIQLTDYEKRNDQAGHEETYAETAARYFGGDPSFAVTLPHLHQFWSRASLPLAAGPAVRAGGKAPPLGTATMLPSGNIELDLRAENDAGIIGHALFELAPSDAAHGKLARRLSRTHRSPGRERTITIDSF